MVNKRSILYRKGGHIFDLILVFITMFFCGLVIVTYVNSTQVLSASVVSPVTVLRISDKALLFQREEFDLLKDVYCESDDLDEVRIGFCSGFEGLGKKGFLMEDSIPKSGLISSGNFCESVYSFEGDMSRVVVKRGGLMKKLILQPENMKSHIRFAVDFEYELKKEYLLTSDDC